MINTSRALEKPNNMHSNLPNPKWFLDTIHLHETKAISEIKSIATISYTRLYLIIFS